MLINPLKNETTEKQEAQNVSKRDAVNEIIAFLIQNYSEYLSEVDENRQFVENLVKEKVYRDYANMNTDSTIKDILNRLFGYHILQKFIDDKSVTDIRVTRFDNIIIKKNGVWEKINETFYNEEEFLNFVRYCVLKNHGKITRETPIVIVSDRKNNLRIEAGIEPVNVVSPNLVIRIHRPDKIQTMEELCITDIEMFNVDMYKFLLNFMKAGGNIIISGKGGSGKTTLMRNLVNEIPEELSITSNEETAELYSTHPNIIQREIIKNRMDDKNITLADLTAHSLVMSNDVIVIGELKGEKAMAFFDAVATGHRGYATVHADSSISTIDRLVTLMKRDAKAQMYTDKYLRKLLSMSVDLVIFMRNFKVHEIQEVLYNGQNDDVEYNLLYEFEVEKYVKGKSIGKFKKVNEPRGRIAEKIRLTS